MYFVGVGMYAHDRVFFSLIKIYYDMFEDMMDMAMLYSISPELTCQCDEVHTCQQCIEDNKEE